MRGGACIVTMIKTLDDVVLVPTPVNTVKEELRAQLFSELKDKPVTVVSADAGGDPFSVVGGP